MKKQNNWCDDDNVERRRLREMRREAEMFIELKILKKLDTCIHLSWLTLEFVRRQLKVAKH